MFRIIAMVCLAGQDPAECQPPTAQDVMVLGEEPNEMACLRQSQMSAGGVETLRRLGPHEWLKIACERKRG